MAATVAITSVRLVSWLLVYWGLLPQPVSGRLRLEQSVVIGLSSYLSWKYIIVGMLILHTVSSHVYLGSHSFWKLYQW